MNVQRVVNAFSVFSCIFSAYVIVTLTLTARYKTFSCVC